MGEVYGIHMLPEWRGLGAGQCSSVHPCVVEGGDQIGESFLEVPMCPPWSQLPFWSPPQGGKGERGLPGPSGPKGEKGARVSAPAMPAAGPFPAVAWGWAGV